MGLVSWLDGRGWECFADVEMGIDYGCIHDATLASGYVFKKALAVLSNQVYREVSTVLISESASLEFNLLAVMLTAWKSRCLLVNTRPCDVCQQLKA
jgi:hypothetical protein